MHIKKISELTDTHPKSIVLTCSAGNFLCLSNGAKKITALGLRDREFLRGTERTETERSEDDLKMETMCKISNIISTFRCVAIGCLTKYRYIVIKKLINLLQNQA